MKYIKTYEETTEEGNFEYTKFKRGDIVKITERWGIKGWITPKRFCKINHILPNSKTYLVDILDEDLYTVVDQAFISEDKLRLLNKKEKEKYDAEVKFRGEVNKYNL